ncbi:hypothetical protein GXW71_32155 [Roseomonas hellenica]|uniref:Uncharacterized protein n=1 Tax=Plastoroseomonas hellenica TaxID=2687306 RepID=A0ABS5F908_9PROT|nr:hypothetical protein [Plastoroseomonas hellenica]MBR0669047.1 hypothetical protein [Plastoroseomonas hellenica]
MSGHPWERPPAAMLPEAVAALAALAEGRAGDAEATATLAIVTAHQVPELLDAGLLRPGDFGDAALEAMAVVIDAAAAWDEDEESLEEFVAGLEPDDLRNVAAAARPWAAAVYADMVPEAAKRAR